MEPSCDVDTQEGVCSCTVIYNMTSENYVVFDALALDFKMAQTPMGRIGEALLHISIRRVGARHPEAC